MGAAHETSARPHRNGEAPAAEQPQLDPQMVERIMACDRACMLCLRR